MKYTRYSFKITSADNNSEMVQSACDVLRSLGAEGGFESFEETTDGDGGYITTESD